MPQKPGYTLAHPIYLDVPMMVSFLAALEGGVSISGAETSTESGSREKMLAGKAGLRARLFGFGDAELGGETSSQKRDETSFVSQTERHHTAASLFNVLYGYLREDEQVLDVSSPNDLATLRAGHLIEFTGQYLGNPLEDILAFFSTFFPYVDPGMQSSEPANGARSGNPAKRSAAAKAPRTPALAPQNEGVKIVTMMANDLESASVHDLLFRTFDGLEAVVVVSSEFYDRAIVEKLRAGEFRVVGKVTRVLGADQSINLTRRTVMGAAGPDLARETISEIQGSDNFSLDVANPIVEGPAIQVLPMSIFV